MVPTPSTPRPASPSRRNGDIFVSDGHGRNNRVVKFSKDGRFIREWGHHGVGPGEFDQPHDIALDSKGRVFIADRNNNRVQVFDPDGQFIAEWRQFGRPSAVFVSRDDVLYVSDSYSNARINPGFKRGIYIGSATPARSPSSSRIPISPGRSS